MIKEELRQELFDLLSVRFEKLMVGTEFRNSAYIDDGTYEGYISVDEDRFYLDLHAKKTGYKLHEISVTFVDDDNWVLVSKSYHGGKIREQYYRRDLVYDKDLGIPNEVLYSVVDAIRSEAQLIKIIQLVHDVVDVELCRRLDMLVDFIAFDLYLKSTLKAMVLSLGSAFVGQIELKLCSEGDGVKLTAALFNKITGKLLYKFEVVQNTRSLNAESTLYKSDGINADKTIGFSESVITDDDLYECVSILDDTGYKEALIELIPYNGL